MNIDRYGVVGNPIRHSLSPLIHAAFARETKQELKYEKLFAPLDEFASVVDEFFEMGGIGLNVTAPFKTDAFNWVHNLGESSLRSSAVNTIARVEGTFIGHNTDGMGLVNDLKRLGWQLADRRVLILGAGGATQGILANLAAQGADITVANRTMHRAEGLRLQLPSIKTAELSSVRPGWDVVFHATSSKTFESEVSIDRSVFHDSACYDLSYSRTGNTSFTEFVRSTARDVSDGLGMLVEQAALSFKIWRDVQPNTHTVLHNLRKPTRRFISGARCTKCSHADSTYVETDLLGNPIVRGCTDCGHVECLDGTRPVALR